jgi:membrane protein
VDVSERTTPNGQGLAALLKATASDFSRDKCTLRAAALSYSTVFALPPLLILLIKLAGLVWDPQSVQRAIETEFAGLIGVDAAATVGQMMRSGNTATHSTMTTILGFGGLVLGATGAFLSLQDALNAVWEIQPDPRHRGVKRLIASRLLSFGIVVSLAFLLIVSLAVTAAIAAVSHAIGGATVVIEIVNMALSLGTLSLLFAAIGLYLGRSNPGNAFGAASALAVILVWIYYAGALVLAGAEFTQQYAIARGHAIQPKPGSVRVDRGFAR